MNITSIYRLLFVAYCLLEKLVVPKAFTLARGRPWMPDLLSVSPALRYVSTVDRIVSDIKERKGKRNDRVEADTQAANCTQSHFFCFVLHPRFTFSFLPLPCASPPPLIPCLSSNFLHDTTTAGLRLCYPQCCWPCFSTWIRISQWEQLMPAT